MHALQLLWPSARTTQTWTLLTCTPFALILFDCLHTSHRPHDFRIARIPSTRNGLPCSAINVECLEGLFDSYGAFGHGFNNNLELGGPTPIGAQIANLSDTVRAVMQEIALSEQVCTCWMLILVSS